MAGVRRMCVIFVLFVLNTDVIFGAESTTNNTTTGYQCNEPGYFADPNDCRSFYRCTQDLKPMHSTCFWFLHFDSKFPGCTIGPCSTPVKVSGKPIPTLASDFKCKTPGVFPNTYDCRRFYRCDWNLTLHDDLCLWGFGHYSVERGGCAFGRC